MSDRTPTEHDMDIIHALDLSYQHWMDGDSDFERDEAITVKRAMNEISRLRAQLERAREGLEAVKATGKPRCPADWAGVMDAPAIASKYLRELENGGGDE